MELYHGKSPKISGTLRTIYSDYWSQFRHWCRFGVCFCLWCHIAINYPDSATQPAVDKIVNSITENGGRAIAVQAVRRSDEVATMMDATLSEFGKLIFLSIMQELLGQRLCKIFLRTIGTW